MKRVAILLFASAFFTAPAHAGEFLATISGKLFGAAYNVVTSGITSGVGAVVKGVTGSDAPPEQRTVTQQDIEALADHMLQGYPESERAELRPKLIAKMQQAQALHQEQSQQAEAVRMEQQAAAVIGHVVPTSVGNRAIFDAAERAAHSRQRIAMPGSVPSSANVLSAVLGRMFGQRNQPVAVPAQPQEPTVSGVAQPE